MKPTRASLGGKVGATLVPQPWDGTPCVCHDGQLCGRHTLVVQVEQSHTSSHGNLVLMIIVDGKKLYVR